MSIPFPVVILGVISGLTYGILAVGLILIYRTSRIINFAHGEVGALAASVFGVYVYRNHIPYWLLFPAALLLGAAASMLVEVVVVRRLRHAPAVMTIVATLGFAALYNIMELVINTSVHTGSTYPQPPGLPTIRVGALAITPAYTAELIGTPLIVVALVIFLRRSRFGIGIRAAADNRDTATMRGIAPGRMSLLAWSIAGVISAFTAIMQFPSQGFVVVGQNLGPSLLVRALAVAVVARLASLPIALIGGVVLGVVEQVLLWNFPSGGQVEVLLFVVIMVALLVQTRRGGREAEQGSWLAVRSVRPLPAPVARLWSVRHLGKFGAAAVFAGLGLVFLSTNKAAFVMTSVVAFTLVGMSVYVITGLTGQLSLGQLAIAGIAAVFSYHIIHDGVNFVVAVLMAAAYSAVISLVLGIPALRIRGLMLTVSTLAFAVMCQDWLFNQPWAFGSGVSPKAPSVPGIGPLDTGRKYYLVVFPALLAGMWLVWNIQRGSLRRALVALRDNEDGARAFTLHATRLKLQAFAISGFLAGLGGAIYGQGLPQVSGTFFQAQDGITIVAIAAIGGISLMTGSLLGALYLVALPDLSTFGPAGLATSSLGWLLLILYFPGGLAQLLAPLRDRLVFALARLHGVDPHKVSNPAITTVTADEPAAPALVGLHTNDLASRPASSGLPILQVSDLAKHFGGIRAVDGVSFAVQPGEIFGLIGTNGAGKTTLFEMISGFTRPDRGRIAFRGRDVTTLAPERRAELGLVRSFQDARLFPTMTVLDAVRLACERSDPTRVTAGLLGLPSALRADRARDRKAIEVAGAMGLSAYKDKTIAELSTGTRRITELACLAALEPALMLLDEPSSGIAQRETEALGELIATLKDYLEATVLIIEHDIPLIIGLSHRVAAMEAGRVIALDEPRAVANNPRVIDSYLGGSLTAIQRSGAAPAPTRCAALTRSGAPCRRAPTVDNLCSQHARLTQRRFADAQP
jgi:ABC-type branched-subunit amino acid transport system ATPase component/ABC-type branched-subunit amino acid transport system permease subunit